MRRASMLVLGAPLVALSLCHCEGAAAQTAPVETPRPCAAAPHRQFDFWLGAWDVTNADGKLVGHNRIESAHDGCVLIEHWSSVRGVTGTSLNVYDRDRGKWHQTWVDSGGGLLQLDGGVVAGAMVLAGDAYDADAPAKAARQRITWTPLPGGGVRQLWETSTDGGTTWTTVFDGRYARSR